MNMNLMNRAANLRRLAGLFVLLLLPLPLRAQPAVRTELLQRDDGWMLLRDGKPYLIKGAGGGASKNLLANLGGNSFRTWGADNLEAQLDEAEKIGLTVTVGLWLGHERHGFDYSDPAQVRKQLEKSKAAIERYKDHPAVLMWAIGNEMEGYGKGDNAAVWRAVNDIAKLAKTIDPSRPTMTVIAEVGGERVRCIHQLCPDIDVVGINTYAGAATVVKRYRELGGTKPIVITEFGPPGTWEVPKNEWGKVVEPTSTQKAESYRRSYRATVIEGKGLVLGAYAFTWGAKQEMTPTWFGMLLRDNSRVEAADAMSELWTGRPVPNRCPGIEPIELSSPPRAAPGEKIDARVDVKDLEGDPLSYEWVLQEEVAKPSVGGDREEPPTAIDGAVTVTGEGRASVKMPTKPGAYRLYVYVRDGHGGAATANVPLLVEARK
jgi:hypothetical protein